MSQLPPISAPLWHQLGNGHHHGIALPLSGLHSERNPLIGDFRDLTTLIHWLAPLGFTIIQLLPINDSGLDPSPYNALSAFAINPIYIAIDEKITATDYAGAYQAKERYLIDYVRAHEAELLEECGPFIQDNPWVSAYAALKSMRDPVPHILIQYIAYKQLKLVKDYASKLGILLMGDMPILVSPQSADVAEHPDLFNMQFAAGAPPDMYCKEGQYWGFPLYRWDRLAETSYAWWKARLEYAHNFFHMIRIDHVVGLFRIWAIARGAPAKEGFFIPKNEADWLPQGRTILQMMLQSSEMLPVAEDLGVIPDEVRKTLNEFGIPGTKVMRWERNWKGDKHFIDPLLYPPISMTTLSTHDSETLEQWWNDHSDESKLFAKDLGLIWRSRLDEELRFELLKISHQSASRLHINLLSEYLSLFPELRHDNPDLERINIPGPVDKRNWQWRTKAPLETIVKHTGLASALTALSS